MSDQLNLEDQSGREQKPKLRLAVPGESTARESRAGAAASYAVAEATALPTTHLLDYVKVIYKRRWVAMTSFALVVLAATVYSFTATPIYEAKTRLLIEAEEHNVVSFKQVLEEDQQKADYYQTQYNILQSRVLARKTIDALKLWDSPYLGAETKEPSGVRGLFGGAFAWVSHPFGGGDAQVSHEPAAADETTAQSRAIDAFLLKLTVSPIRNSRLVDIKYRLPDPALAASIVNTLAKNYIEQNLEYKF